AYLERRGFELERGLHLSDRKGYLAGADEDRRRDLERQLSDPRVNAIWFARGGYGSGRIVSGIDWKNVARTPKALIGYSDLTVIQAAAYRAGRLVTFQGPMIGNLGDAASFDEASLWQVLQEGAFAFAQPIERRSILRQGTGEGPLV